MKTCKRCNGKGMILENHKGDSGMHKFYGISFKTGKPNSVKGQQCPKCYGRGQL